MSRSVEILEYLPELLREIKDFKAIADAQNPELKKLWQEIENAFLDQYIETATERGVARRESMLKIVPKATDSMEDRKFRLKTRYGEQLPYTRRTLNKRLSTLCGKEGYTIEYPAKTHTIKVRIDLVAKEQLRTVDKLLDDIAPMDMIIDLDLRYNLYSKLESYKYDFFKAKKYIQVRDEVIK